MEPLDDMSRLELADRNAPVDHRHEPRLVWIGSRLVDLSPIRPEAENNNRQGVRVLVTCTQIETVES